MEHVKFSLAEKGDQSAAERWFIQLLPTYFPGEFASVCDCVRVKERFHMVPYAPTGAAQHNDFKFKATLVRGAPFLHSRSVI